MRKFFVGACALLLTCSLGVAQPSLLKEATNGLFSNVNDFIIKPNVMFNTVSTRQIIIGGGFDNLGFQSNATGGGLLGYYHPGSLPWSVAATFDMKSGVHRVKDVNGQNTTTYKSPVFANYEGGLRFTLGVPDAMNLSAGLVLHFKGAGVNQEETIASNGTSTYKQRTESFDMQLGIPVGIDFGPVYNHFEPFIIIGNDTEVTAQNARTTTTNVTFLIYDKVILNELLPSPFGKETSFWLGMGNINTNDENFKKISGLEKPSHALSGLTFSEVKFGMQLGAANLLDFSAGVVQLRIKPMVYIDLLIGTYNSYIFGTTIATAAGVYAPLGDLPLAIFFGVTPGFLFYTGSQFTQQGSEQTDRALTTNVFWTGKVGTSIKLPKDMELDVTLDVDTADKSLGLSAQMSVSL